MISQRIDWLDAFARQQKEKPVTAVEAARARDRAMLDQIVSIVSGQPTHGSVESKVREMQERTGLKEYLQRVSYQQVLAQIKLAGDILPDSFNQLPEMLQNDIKNYIYNVIETHHGNISVPALAESVLSTFRNQGVGSHQINDPSFEKYISDQILGVKKNNPDSMGHNTNIGKGVGIQVNDNESNNSDVFANMLPNKG